MLHRYSVSRERRGLVDRITTTFVRRWQTVTTMADRERGDVPGWVLVTVMTAGLVTALWVIADDQLSSILRRAFDSVTNR